MRHKSISPVVLYSCLVKSDASFNLKMFNDPKSQQWKNTVYMQPRHTSATSCAPLNLSLIESQELFKSQNNEDNCLLQYFFPGVCEGQYLDIGAYDGIQLSHSYAFYASPELKWRGVNIELDPENYNNLIRNRRGDMANIHAAVCSDVQTVHYTLAKNKAEGGLWEFSSEAHRNQWWPNMTIFQSIPMKCTPIQRILEKGVKCDNLFFDFVSIDIVGAEYSALLGFNFDKVGFGVILLVRNDREDINWHVDDLLHSKGYDKVTNNPCNLMNEKNVWFINRDFGRIYHDLIVQRENYLLRGH